MLEVAHSKSTCHYRRNSDIHGKQADSHKCKLPAFRAEFDCLLLVKPYGHTHAPSSLKLKNCHSSSITCFTPAVQQLHFHVLLDPFSSWAQMEHLITVNIPKAFQNNEWQGQGKANVAKHFSSSGVQYLPNILMIPYYLLLTY